MSSQSSPAARRSRRWQLPLAMLAVLCALAACSTQREGSGGGGGQQCANADQAQAGYHQTWTSSAEQLGLSGIEPTPTRICQVDTSRWESPPSSGERYRIALAAQGPTNTWALLNEEAFRHRAQERGVEVLYASANGDATTQVDNIQQLASQDPDAMVVVPMGSGITGQVRAAAARNIPVVLCAGRLEGDSGAVSTVTRSYELLGTLYAEWLVAQLGGQGQVAMLSGIPGVPTAEYPKAAARAVFARHPGIEVVTEQYTNWSLTEAKTVGANLLAQYPGLRGIWSDSGITDLGLAQAYQEAGVPLPPLTGDSNNGFLKAVQGTDARFAMSTFPPEQSTQCLDTALNILAGQPVLDQVNIDSPSFTHAQLAQYVRPNCSDNLPVPSRLPDELLVQLDLCQG